VALKDAPTGEIGAPGIASSIDGWIDSWDDNPLLRWPHNVHIYDRMRTDAHLESGLDAIHLPILQTPWDLTPDSVAECRPEVVKLVREDIGIAEKGTRLRRPRNAVVFDDFLRHALLQDVFGHMVFEQCAEVIDGKARLRKLAPRMPKTIQGWDLDRHGGLQAIKQLIPLPNGQWDEKRIAINRLVVFTRRKEGSDPTGRSILRSAWVHWIDKVGLLKVDTMSGERNGMGVPVVYYDPNRMTKKEALDIASNVRAGEFAAAAFEEGAGRLELLGVDGQVKDLMASIRYHDQEMSRRMLAMFLDLGHDNGARSLGETFVDFFVMAVQAEAKHIAGVINEHVIRDLVEWNYGPDEPWPLLECDEITADADVTAASLKMLAESGYIIPDPASEAVLRRRYRLPESPIGAPPGIAPVNRVDQPDETPDDGTIEALEQQVARLKAGPRAVPTRVAST